MKYCKACGEEKEDKEFSKSLSRKDGLKFYCKECEAKKRKEYKEKYPEKVKEYNQRRKYKNREKYLLNKKEYREGHKDVIKNYALKTSYGITFEEYTKQYEIQSGKCAICEFEPQENDKALAVDHDHKSNQIRGLLCTNCNIGLGYFKDSIDLLRKAIDYLNKHKEGKMNK